MKKILLSLMLVVSLFAEFKVGDKIEDFTLPDQFDNNITFNSDIKTIIMTFEKDVAVGVNDFLKTKDKEFLIKNSTIFIADISSMPSFVTSMFALPKMRKYPYSVGLIYDEFGEKFNIQDEKITIYKVNQNEIKEILFIDDIKKVFE